MNIALVENGMVINVVLMDDDWTGAPGEWQPPSGVTAVQNSNATIGDAYDGTTFTRKIVWNDIDGNPVPDFEIDVDNPPPKVEPVNYNAIKQAEKDRAAGIKASTYVTDWDTNIKGKTFLEIKTLYDGATQAQKSALLLYLLLVRALEVKG